MQLQSWLKVTSHTPAILMLLSPAPLWCKVEGCRGANEEDGGKANAEMKVYSSCPSGKG